MKFNTGKCEVICITNKRKVINRAYKIHGQTVQNTNKAKYLGVTIDSSLTWNAHVDAIAKRSSSTILLTKKPTILPKGCKGHVLYVSHGMTSATIQSHSMGPQKQGQHKQVRSCTLTCSKILPQQLCTSSVSAMIKNLSWEQLQAWCCQAVQDHQSSCWHPGYIFAHSSQYPY